ncbi:mevalonate kinase [Pseudogracilibacillus auburnensis]|uniref:mevalonate kinase n=1 Tax=Pseudogracilibacillus auburnensis TaxID=1494959 RepID=A0A2V3VUR6_9BACI|nr:mevalonate kinase [Pseudogracilibacillus auburnensis]MBO1004038.1 mevalonate kinase [Pseudogracilibacillus auburnensis]PXW85672.1 mevalonate kinase [Pseudogracilibacillus auburnensis]
MSVEKVTISEKMATGVAHSKLILVGEHAVVHGQPAIAIPFPLIGVESIVERVIGNVYLDSSLYQGPMESAPKSLAGIVNTIKQTLKILKIPYRDLLIRIQSSIPPGKGLGSSASVAIAVVKSLFMYSDKEYTNEQLLQLANISETFAHGAPSGIDPLTITSPSPIWYKKEEPIDYIQPTGEFYFVVADSGRMADTKTAIDTVTSLLKLAPKKVYGKIERIGDITYQVREALEKSSKQLLGTLLNEAQKELEAIGVSDSSLNKLIHFARQEGALGAKLTGGGNGGCIIALARNEIHSMQLSEKLKQFGAQAVWPFVLKNE